MSTQENVRDMVSKTYARAVTEPGAGCCGGGSACGAQKGVLAKMAGYDAAELASLPDDAVVNSFGCGNPLAFAEVLPGQTVLDLGSGAGIDLILAARKVGPAGRVIGVDMTDAMIERARQNIAAAGFSNIEIRKGIIEALPVEAGSVDWVISNCVINLSPEKERVFAEIARVLAPGGRMRVSDVVANELPEAVRRNASLYSSCIAGAISEAAYVEGLRRAGLSDVNVVERFVYDASQLRALAVVEAEQQVVTLGAGPVDLGALVDSVVGKVWSMIVTARKPS